MKISIFGLGYVGAVSAGCLAQQGHHIVGVDVNRTKVSLINSGKPPIVEKDIEELIGRGIFEGRLSATLDVADAINQTELSLICVGTPSQLNGNLDLSYVRNVCEEIGLALKGKQNFHVVVVRSTMLPGSMRDTVIPTLEQFSGKKAGEAFGVCNNPEFLREGTAVYDFYNPPKTVIGETDERSGDILASIYSELPGPLLRTSVETAEMVKYVDNVWHALKVCFGNEVGNLCKALGIDGHEVMDIFCQDEKLNLSPYYLKPGFAFGGSCLPKDVRALTYRGRMLDVDLPVLNAIIPSNRAQVEKGIDLVTHHSRKKVGVLGISFKAGTDDLRESPIIELIERLLGKGYDIRVYDRNVQLASLTGANKDYVLNRVPHISRLMLDSVAAVIEHAETIVIGNSDPEFREIASSLSADHLVIDLVRIEGLNAAKGKYVGICW